MVSRKKKVFVALSGGVDSSTAGALLLEAGYDCSAVFMITNDKAEKTQADAERIADKLKIKLYVVDFRRVFEKTFDYFCSEYKRARTPNPCVFCNREIKFGKLLDFAFDKGADFFATGHYARVLQTGKGPALYSATDSAKDQSYALAMVKRNILGKIILPMGYYSKQQARRLAAKFGLGTEMQAESQEICFIPDNDYASFVEKRCPELAKKGDITDSSGKILGRHNGIHKYIIGQRRGLRVAMGIPHYVTKIDAAAGTVTLGARAELLHRKLTAENINWLCDRPAGSFRAKVKIRYNFKAASAVVTPKENGIEIEFARAVSAITPGQTAVFYLKDRLGRRVGGGGWIYNVSD